MDTNTPLTDLFPSRWLKAKDLTDAGQTTITARVDRVTIEDVKPLPAEPAVQRLALWLHGHKPYLVTSKTDAATLAEYGATTPAQLVGKVLTVRLDVWRRQAVLRIAPPPATPRQPQPRNQPPASTPPVATSTPPVATAQAATPPPVITAQASATPPVATAPEPTASSTPAVQLWPPREGWVCRKRGGEVDWVTSFWQCGAALKVSRADAQAALQAAGGSFEDAAAAMWEQAQAGQAGIVAEKEPAF